MRLKRIRDYGTAKVVVRGVRHYNGLALSPRRVMARPHFAISVNGQLAGWIGYELRRPHVYEIAHLSVRPRFRRRGLAETAVGRVLFLVRRAGGRHVYARIRRTNYASQGLFRKCAFRRVSRGRRFYRFARGL
ncbi:MAG TPA: hypothetical protein DDZ53_01420 [Firmicutes bacterium]|nr:hypothetical protein [Bacillota bacterium]